MDKYSSQAEEMYDNEAEKMDTPNREKVFVKAYRKVYNKLKIVDDDIVLDVGCGTGKMALAIGNCVKKYIGIDLSQKVLNIATKNKLNNQIFLKKDMQNTGFNNGYFTKIIALTSIDQVFGRKKALLECNRILNDKGLMYIEVRNKDYIVKKAFKKFIPYFNKIGLTKPMPINEFQDLSYNEWLSLIKESGFDVVARSRSIRPYYGESIVEKARHILIEICKIIVIKKYQYMIAYTLKKHIK
jgi:ubiquinone/menaquinone biosynthesis C-methylase UbiE